MRKTLFKLAAVILCLAMLFTSLSVSAIAEPKYSVVSFTTEEVKNPAYDNEEAKTGIVYSVKPKTYNSQGGTFDTALCTNDINSVIADIRKTMVNREASVDVYYKDGILHDNNSFSNMLAEWIELTLAETENPYEGDYLRYVYGGYNGRIDTQYIQGEGVYYHHIVIDLSYYTTKAQEAALEQKMAEVIEDFNFSSTATAKQKSDIIYDYITCNVTYDNENLGNNDYKLQYTAYAALINGTAVCQGYATLFYRMARECGLEARVVVGTSRGQNHAWNIVKIGNLYYYLDSTWDEGGRTAYYLKGAPSFTEDHTPEEQFFTTEFTQNYPISDNNYNIGEINGLVEGDFEYKVNMSKAVITKYNGNAKNIIIPATIGGFPVERLGKNVFYHNYVVETLTFEEGIKGIEMESIFGCDALKQINLPSTFNFDYEKYGDFSLGGFSTVPNYCDKLEKITLAEDNKYMKLVDGILYSADMKSVILCPQKYNKTVIELPDTIETIVPWSFYGCDKIKEVIMPDTVKYIGYWGFKSCSSLEKINISNSCETIGQFAFGDTKIKSIYIPASMETIMSAAFGTGCDLKEIIIDPENENFYLDGAAFCRKYSDTDTVVMIDYMTDDPATTYTIPEDVDAIEQYALAEADNLKKLIIPATVTRISSYAFESCENLEHVEFQDGVSTYPNGALLYCTNLVSVIIPASMTIEDDNFVGIDTDKFTIYGEPGTEAQAFANRNNVKFKNISEFICEDGHVMKKVIEDDHWQMVCKKCGDGSLYHWRTDITNAAYYGKTEKDKYVYTGTPIKPEIKSITEYDRELIEGVDYKIVGYKYNNAPGWGSIVIEGLGDFRGTGELQFMIIEPLKATEKLAAYLYGHDDVKLGWRQVDGADGYLVYYKKSSSSSYIYKGSTTNLYYKFADLTDNTSYTFKVVAYYHDGSKRQIASKYKTLKISTLRDLKAPANVTANLYGYDDVALSWSKVSYAKGYYVYYKNAKSSSYTYAGKTTGTTFKKANLYDGVNYIFKIVPYGISGTKIILDSSYKTASVYTLKKVSTPVITKYNSSKVRVTWTNIPGEGGYQISKSTSKTGTSIASTVWTTTGNTKVISAIKGKAYYYKVRAFKKVGSKIIYGPWSTAKFYRLK